MLRKLNHIATGRVDLMLQFLTTDVNTLHIRSLLFLQNLSNWHFGLWSAAGWSAECTCTPVRWQTTELLDGKNRFAQQKFDDVSQNIHRHCDINSRCLRFQRHNVQEPAMLTPILTWKCPLHIHECTFDACNPRLCAKGLG